MPASGRCPSQPRMSKEVVSGVCSNSPLPVRFGSEGRPLQLLDAEGFARREERQGNSNLKSVSATSGNQSLFPHESEGPHLPALRGTAGADPRSVQLCVTSLHWQPSWPTIAPSRARKVPPCHSHCLPPYPRVGLRARLNHSSCSPFFNWRAGHGRDARLGESESASAFRCGNDRGKFIVSEGVGNRSGPSAVVKARTHHAVGVRR